VVGHAVAEEITGKDVIGVLPHSLSCLCNSFTEVPLRLPPELRGQELTIEDLRKAIVYLKFESKYLQDIVDGNIHVSADGMFVVRNIAMLFDPNLATTTYKFSKTV
jgi:hypothetical protein